MIRPISVLCVLLVSAFLATAADAPASLSGSWVGKQVRAGDGTDSERPMDASLVLMQEGSALTGAFTGGEAKSAKLEAGRIGADGKITFAFHDSQNYLFTGQVRVTGDTLEGRITRSTGLVMNIFLKKQ